MTLNTVYFWNILAIRSMVSNLKVESVTGGMNDCTGVLAAGWDGTIKVMMSFISFNCSITLCMNPVGCAGCAGCTVGCCTTVGQAELNYSVLAVVLV